MAAKISSFSDFGDNYSYLPVSCKYRIGIHLWHLPLCKLYTCFDLFLLNHHNCNDCKGPLYTRSRFIKRE